MKQSVSGWVGVSVAVGALAVGCGGAPRAQEHVARAPAAAVAAPKQTPEEREQHEAQVAWCDYLNALYLRAAPEEKTWARYDQCAAARTTAAPRMLRQTAICSKQALEGFSGDPFTEEYASQVSACGAEAMDAMTASASDLAPYVAAICGRVKSCGEIDYGECRSSLEIGLGQHLERAIGSMNAKGRGELKACLRTVTCDGIGQQITGCLEPIMQGLLWLPG